MRTNTHRMSYVCVLIWICFGLFGCFKHKGSTENTREPVVLSDQAKHIPSVWLPALQVTNKKRVENYQILLGLERLSSFQRREMMELLWLDSDPYVRMAIVQFLYQTYKNGEDTTELQELLALGYTYDISMEERCRLAMQLYALDANNRDKYIAEWKIVSTGTLDEQYTCAIAGNYILHVSSPLYSLFSKGDFPLSITFVEDLLLFLHKQDALVLQNNLEWAEEEMFGLLFLVVLQQSTQDIPSVDSVDWLASWKEQKWNGTQCLDMVDLAWRFPSAVYTDMLTNIAKSSISYVENTPESEQEMCSTMAKMALFSITGSYDSVVLAHLQKIDDEDREMGVLAIQAVILAYLYHQEDAPIFMSKRSKNLLIKSLEKLLEYDQDPLILKLAIQSINLIGVPSSFRQLKQLSEHTRVDPIEQFWADVVLWNHNIPRDSIN